MMTIYILIGLLNGVCIALSRILNGQLSGYQGAFKASYINHIGGFCFLSLMTLILLSPPQFAPASEGLMYAGGVIGALYVAINSVVITKLGSTSAIILVISGQMLFSLLLDTSSHNPDSLLMKIAGVSLIIIGMTIKELLRQNSVKVQKQNQE